MEEPSKSFPVSLDDAVVLLVGMKLLGEMVETIEINDVPQDRRIENLVRSLSDVLPEDLQDLADEIVEDILYNSFEDIPVADSAYNLPMYAIEETMPVLERAITERHSVEIEYYSMSREEVNQRKLNPYGIRKIGNFFWLAAFCHWRKENRLFRVDRIKTIRSSREAFELPAGLSIEELFGKGKR
ncbi:MAG: helix-turn-helix transcriptional regulator [Bacteroidota bacterium]